MSLLLLFGQSTASVGPVTTPTAFVQSVHHATGPERISYLALVISRAWVKNPSSYWTFTARILRSGRGQTIGENLGDPVSLRTQSIAAGKEMALYDGGDHWADLNDGDEVLVYVDRVGKPVPLLAPRVIKDVQAGAQ